MLGGAQGNTGTVIIGKNPVIDNPLDPWWDIQGAVNSAAKQVNTDKTFVSGVSGAVSSVKSGLDTANSIATEGFSITKLLGEGSTWKAIGLILAGGIMLILAVVEFTAGGAVQMVQSARPRL